MDFYHPVARILFFTKRARPDICTVISFLITRLIEPNNDDWAKLVHPIKYIRGTRNLPPIMSSNRSGIIKWWIDGSFAVHTNMRGNTDVDKSIGRGFTVVGSTKHKTCSSPRRTFFLHALSLQCTSKLCVTFLNLFLVYFYI